MATLVSFHAHPDDESLLTGGTLARAAAEGHRTVLVTATDGAAGLADASWGSGAELGRRRLAELEEAAARLGVARVVPLGHVDGGFAAAGVDGPAAQLHAVLAEESAAVLTGYDPSGGYGHPDHVHVHRVARAAARLVAADGQRLRLLEASVDRALLLRAARLLHRLPGAPEMDLERLAVSYLAREELTHRVDVRAFVPAKIEALAAHGSQQTGGRGLRTVTVLRRLPGPLARAVLGREWFREVGTAAGGRPLDDVMTAADRPARPERPERPDTLAP